MNSKFPRFLLLTLCLFPIVIIPVGYAGSDSDSESSHNSDAAEESSNDTNKTPEDSSRVSNTKKESKGVDELGKKLTGVQLYDIKEITEALKNVIAEFDGRHTKREDTDLDFAYNLLLLGEADFSFTAAYLRKHPRLVKHVIATEIQSQKDIQEEEKKEKSTYLYTKNLKDCQEIAREQGLPEFKFHHGVNARELHTSGMFEKRRVRRTQFNFPMDNAGKWATKWEETKDMLADMFKCTSDIQKIGDRIRVTLPHDNDHWRDITQYGIYPASSKARYVEIKRHLFKNRSYDASYKGPERYFGYEHRQDINAGVAGENTGPAVRKAREHVFAKTAMNEQQIRQVTRPRSHCNYPGDALTKDIDTDDESESEGGVGNCLFEALADIGVYNRDGTLRLNAIQLRQRAMWQLQRDSEQDLRDIVNAGAGIETLMTMDNGPTAYTDIADYITYMRTDGTWGGYIEIVALANYLSRPVEIYTMPSNRLARVAPRDNSRGLPVIRLAYLGGNHYEPYERIWGPLPLPTAASPGKTASASASAK